MKSFISPFLGLRPGTRIFSVFFMAALCFGALPFFGFFRFFFGGSGLRLTPVDQSCIAYCIVFKR